jgi:potassium-transporting ATPase KdpC subunit
MSRVIISALRASLATFVLCGLLYPISLTGFAQLFLPFQANGSLERGAGGVVIGSRLIGQDWNEPQWFHGRPSATTAADAKDPGKTVPAPYNAANSAGSNLGPTSKTLAERLMYDRRVLERAQPELAGTLLPADMLTTSASGLDPDITPANAALQVARVARARGMPVEQIERLLDQYVTGRSLGIFGEPRVNVLALNLAIEGFCPSTAGRRDPCALDRTRPPAEHSAITP